MKQVLLDLMMVAGAFAAFRNANRNKALILMYHRFGHSDDGCSTSASTLKDHLEYLNAHYTLTSLSRIARHLQSGETLPPGLAAITIDDGFHDTYEVAFPLLRRYETPATLFVVTEFLDNKAWIWTDKLRFLTSRTLVSQLETTVGGCLFNFSLNGPASRLNAVERINQMLKRLPDNEKEESIVRIASTLKVALPELPPAEYGPLTWRQAREMDKHGVEIASHTVTHPILTNVGNERLRHELRESRRRLETMLDRDVKLFCYPNGEHDERVVHEVELAGYDCAVTTKQGLNASGSDLLSLHRIPAVTNFARFVKATSGFEQAQNYLRRE